MGSLCSKRHPQLRNPTAQRSYTEAERFVAEHGVDDIGQFYREQMNEWREAEINIAISGDTGAGKPSFINSIRGLRPKDEGAAREGVTEVKSKPKAYPHPTNPKLIFWDMPGIGGVKYPSMEEYCKCKEIDVEKYDAFLIFSKGRFTNHDSLLAEKAKSLDKPFFFIRAHIGSDVENAKSDEEDGKFDEEEVLQNIRDDCYDNLKKILKSAGDIYLIDNKKKQWDFERLIAAISDVMPPRVKEAFILSLSNLTQGCIRRKATQLKVRASVLATAVAPANAIPIPLLGASLNIALIVEETSQYRELFGIPPRNSATFNNLDEEFKTKVIKSCYSNAAQLVAAIASECGTELGAEEVAKLVPIAGVIMATAISAFFTSRYLFACINELEEIALQIWNETVRHHREPSAMSLEN
ncbi:interferon-inducible GTPase 5-like [Dendronephthya gigantea]|uniref:interferon-inducible GTPase 5-like n=1 Tax=Dendronephthya gigantea TaxID=151771 RepID=UPI00106B2DF3|nr:interferon-inducible GTPase 5-like [Dendronephthya gigantea]